MADDNECGQHVTEYLDKEFGDDLQRIENVFKVFQERENLRISLEKKIRICKETTTQNIRKSGEEGKKMLKEIDLLAKKNVALQDNANEYFEKQSELSAQLNILIQQIEEINCMQVYLNWIFQICHLSDELKKELEKGNLSIAVEFCVNLAEITERLKQTSCRSLLDYATTKTSYWMTLINDILSRDMTRILEEMKWPFPTGISAPALTVNSQDIMSHFKSVALLLLKIQIRERSKTKPENNKEISKLTSVLVAPFTKRFAFHFYGPRKTNNNEKPEWYFTQVLNWIRDHSSFIESYIQPDVDKTDVIKCDIFREFISAMISTCMEKIKSSLPQVCTNESLFSHLIDEVLLFDQEIKSSYNYAPGCTSALITKPYIDQWLHIEKKSALQVIDKVLCEDEVFSNAFEESNSICNMKAPNYVQHFMLHLSLITDRYRNIDDTEAQLKFAELQIYLLEVFIKRLKELATEANVSSSNEMFYSLLNGCHYMIMILNEWTEQVFYIQLHCVRYQQSSKQSDFWSARLEDSLNEDNINTSIEHSEENSDLLIDQTLFDEIIANLETLISALIESLSERIEINLKSFINKYSSLTWHSLPSSKDVVTPMLTNAACHLLMFIKETLNACQNELAIPIFTMLWQNLARNLDSIIFNKVILVNHFNEGGAMQLKFDLMKNLFLLFQGYTQKPESYFKLVKESCSLLTLLPGSAVLLKDLLKSSEKLESKKDEAINALNDIDVKYISPSIAYRILCSRIDWPKI